MTTCTRLERPQPVGILPIPAGLLVLPAAGPEAGAARQQCMRGDLPTAMPAPWLFYASAARGDLPTALQQLAEDTSAEAAYNRFVLNADEAELSRLRDTLSGELRVLLELAAYTSGLVDAVPDLGPLDDELRALALMIQAAAAMEIDAPREALTLLQRAVDLARGISPLFAVQLLAQMAALAKTQPDPMLSEARQHYREAIDLLGAASMPELASDLWMQLAILCHENARGRESWFNEAIEAYQQVLRGPLVPEEHRDLFALAHNNLGLVFLIMPMGEAAKHLRMGVAIQSFREGLGLCDRDADPDLWASLQSNLASALQYLPSSHPEENLAQAVELYEELVSVGRKAFDPVGYGKILANQANALAHLGIFSPALEKLQEARKLFEWHNETELAASALEQVGHIHQQIGIAGGRA